MTRKKRLRLRFLVPAALVGVALWYVRWWPFNHAGSLPAANIPAPTDTVGDAVQKAYSALSRSFRDKVPAADFAAMFHRMTEPGRAADLPQVRQATVAEGAGPENPVAKLRVEYPGAKTKAEYRFARIGGSWQLESYARIQGDWRSADGDGKAPTETTGKTPRGHEEEKRPAGERAKPGPTAPGSATAAGGASPRYYTVQPGDTLSSISQRLYGTKKHWHRILEANPGISERRVPAGRKIVIPSGPDLPALKEEPTAEPKAKTATP
jgi:LysM repeat protein